MTPRIGARVTVWAALVVVVGVALVPIGYLVSLSVRPPGDVLNSSLVPSEWTTWNFVSVFHTIALDTMLGNSWVSAVGAALLAVVIAVPAAYFTARRFRGERLLTVLLASYCAPPVVAIIPLFFLLRYVGLTNSVAGLVVVNGIANVPVAAWLLDGFVRRIPVEIDEAAVVDGLSVAGAFRKGDSAAVVARRGGCALGRLLPELQRFSVCRLRGSDQGEPDVDGGLVVVPR
jgi:multiple sugar transport system permease protein